VADHSRSRFPVAHARQPGGERAEKPEGLNEPAARSLEYWAAVRGGSDALFEGDLALTYRDWNDYADMLADSLASRGLGVDDVIAVRCANRIEWAVIALACAKIDARLLTLDPELPAGIVRERVIAGRAAAMIVGDSAPGRLAPALEGLNLRLRAAMDGAFPGFFNFWDLFPPVARPRFGRVQPSLLAWTTGSTGSPLPVALPRRRNAPASVSRPPLPETGASLITTPFHRVWGQSQFWTALAAGRAIALIRSFTPQEALATIARRRVTHWTASPASFLAMVELGVDAIRESGITSLRELMIGGSAIPPGLKAWLVEAFGPILGEVYGSAEAGLVTQMTADRQHERPDSCGRPIRGAVVEVRDRHGARLPAGATGEIWARTQRTVECDLPVPSHRNRRDEEGFLATGDVGRMDADGFLYVTGRAYDLAGMNLRATG
jgi:acyl-CoA synthetase (AMP-forming)/AMP-acid ligase II